MTDTIIRNITAPMYVSISDTLYKRTSDGDEKIGTVVEIHTPASGGFTFIVKNGSKVSSVKAERGSLVIWS